MQFDPKVHTKEFLMANAHVVIELARCSSSFSLSELVNDAEILGLKGGVRGWTVAHYLALYQPQWFLYDASKDPDILRLADKYGWTVAHILAEHQPEWLLSEASKDPVILELKNHIGETVAHHLAEHQPQWLLYDASKDLKILGLKNTLGFTVAHKLAKCQPQWLNTNEAKNPEVLQLADIDGCSVALTLIFQESCLDHEPLFYKSTLSLSAEGKLLAEHISEYYGESHGLDVSTMAMKMISQGAAYIHSKPMPLKVGEKLLKQAKTIVDDSMESLVTLKKLQALYSTFYHQVEKIKATKELKSLDKWLSMLGRVEILLADHLNANPALLDIDHNIDIFCEPGDELLKRLASEHVLKNNLSLADGYDVPVQDLQSNTGLY
jgi:hypothetical protein